jgi:opacity protein-like surface antigen
MTVRLRTPGGCVVAPASPHACVKVFYSLLTATLTATTARCKRQYLLVLLGLLLPAVSMAETSGYVGAMLSRVDYEESGAPDVRFTAAGIRLGAAFNPHFALEFRWGFGLGDESVSWYDMELNHYFGAYARFMLPVSEQVKLYALIGGTRAKLTASSPHYYNDAEDIENGASYGAGAEMNLGRNVFASLEYARLLSGSDYDLNAWTIGVARRF